MNNAEFNASYCETIQETSYSYGTESSIFCCCERGEPCFDKAFTFHKIKSKLKTVYLKIYIFFLSEWFVPYKMYYLKCITDINNSGALRQLL